MSLLRIVALLLEALLGLFSTYAAYSLFTGTPPSMARVREALHYPRWYWILAGCMATTGSLGLLVGLFFPVIGVLAATWMVAYFVVATFTHLLRKDFAGLAMPLIFLMLPLGLLALRWAEVTRFKQLLASRCCLKLSLFPRDAQPGRDVATGDADVVCFVGPRWSRVQNAHLVPA
ncbi:MAG TPA: DoxX family protein [Ktedonobacteraceae bacterium]|nr:DoxX family protein [Ktedonobacteraceae bacterium]